VFCEITSRDRGDPPADEKNPELKDQLEKQAVTYRKLASERARKLGLPSPPPKASCQPLELERVLEILGNHFHGGIIDL
jgi:hypothetical protein